MQSVEKVYKEIYNKIENNFNNLKFLSSGKNASNFASRLNMKLQRATQIRAASLILIKIERPTKIWSHGEAGGLMFCITPPPQSHPVMDATR